MEDPSSSVYRRAIELGLPFWEFKGPFPLTRAVKDRVLTASASPGKIYILGSGVIDCSWLSHIVSSALPSLIIRAENPAVDFPCIGDSKRVVGTSSHETAIFDTRNLGWMEDTRLPSSIANKIRFWHGICFSAKLITIEPAQARHLPVFESKKVTVLGASARL